MKKLLCFCFCLLFSALLCSCASNKYSETLSCGDITKSLKSDILADKEYKEYTDSEAKYVFDECESFDSCSIIYSASSDDIGEIGVFHANTEAEAIELLQDAKQHISEEKDDKSEFLRNYLPNEIKKLENADVRRYENYVVYTILSPEERDAVFSYVEKLLKK